MFLINFAGEPAGRGEVSRHRNALEAEHLNFGKHQMSYFWRDAWFTNHIGYDQQTGDSLSGYCDVILPNATYTNTTEQMIYTDRYIDVVVREDYSVYTKDHEVFDRAALRYPIIEQSRKPAFEVLDW